MEWLELKTQEAIEDFMNDFCGFHDSCITNVVYSTGMVVEEDKSMGIESEKNNAKIIFQSQIADAIEIHFQEIQILNINTNINRFEDIFGATFKIINTSIYWIGECFANDVDFQNTKKFLDKGDSNFNYIICKKVSYRKIKK